MSGAGKVHIGPPSILSILSFFLSACRMYSSCKSSCNSSCKDVVKTASLRLTLFAYVSIGIRFLWCILSHTVERGRQQNLWLRTSSNQFLSHSISSSFCRGGTTDKKQRSLAFFNIFCVLSPNNVAVLAGNLYLGCFKGIRKKRPRY